MAAYSDNTEIISSIIESVAEYLGDDKLKELLIETNMDGRNVLQCTMLQNNFHATEALLTGIKEHLGIEIIQQLALNCSKNGHSVLQYASLGNYEAIDALRRTHELPKFNVK